MEAGRYTHDRPVGVTVLVVLLWIEAFIQVIGGAVFIFARNDPDVLSQTALGSDAILAVGIALVIIGLVYMMVAGSLGRGSGFARFIVSFFTLLQLIGNVYVFFAVAGHAKISALVSIGIGVLILYILYGERGSAEFFSRG